MRKLLLYILILCASVASAQVPALNETVKTSILSSSKVGAALEVSEPYTAAGTDTYTVSIGVTGLYSGAATYSSGDQFTIIFTNANATTTPTLNINGEGAKTIVDNKGDPVAVGDVEGILKLMYDGTNLRIVGGVGTGGGSGISRDFHRTWSETIDFSHNEIFFEPHELTANIVYEIGDLNLIDEGSAARQRIITDGTYSLSFGDGFDFIYGIQNGDIPDAGTYEIYFLYTNGSAVVNFPGISQEESSGLQLSIPSNFAAVADGETAIDISWDNVTNNEGYLVQFSLTGTGGWTTLENVAEDGTTSTQTGLGPGVTRYYRITTLGNGINTFDSEISSVTSATTESSGDTSPPEFIFLPVSGNTVWPVNKPIVITADEGLRNTDGSEITNANVATRITLKETNGGGANITFTATIDGSKTVITIIPTIQYGEAQLVYVAINNVEDVNGNEVNVAESITFTTTDYTYFNGVTSRLQFGDMLDALWADPDVNFWLELTVNNVLLSGSRPFVTKYSTSDNQRTFQWYHIGTDVYFSSVGTTVGANHRVIKWTNVLTAGSHTLVLKMDVSIDTNDGLDRPTLLIDNVVQGSKTLDHTSGLLVQFLSNGTAQLAIGAYINNAGTPIGNNFFTEEAKDFIVRSSAGTVVELNVPNLKLGTDISGNSRNGTWVP